MIRFNSTSSTEVHKRVKKKAKPGFIALFGSVSGPIFRYCARGSRECLKLMHWGRADDV